MSEVPSPVAIAAPVAIQPSVITSLIDVFHASPVLLLIVLLNVAFAAAGGYVISQLEAQRHVERIAMMDRCLPDVNGYMHILRHDGSQPPPPTKLEAKPWGGRP